MSKFFIIFLSVYSAMHFLFFLRIRVLFPEGRWIRWIPALFLALMIFAPIGTRLLERAGHETLAQITAPVAFFWMGFIFLGFAAVLLMNIFDLFSYGINRMAGLNLPSLSGKTPVLVMLGCLGVLCIYGFFEARHIRTEQISILTDKLPPGVEKLRIVQISDVHLGLLTRDKGLKKISERIRSLSPDILVCTGDLVDGSLSHLPELSDILKNIRPPYGKYAVTGNHEYYAGLDDSVKFMEKSGFSVLQGQARTVDSLINIAGVDDRPANGATQEHILLSSVQNGLFTLFLKHRPLVAEETHGLFDLQLSGHTHGGQIFPFRYIVSVPFPFVSGYYELPKGSRLYTSRGTGTWGPQMRILSPPEITVFELTR
jgi:predicted MPP superfamily phosphohydrolase